MAFPNSLGPFLRRWITVALVPTTAATFAAAALTSGDFTVSGHEISKQWALLGLGSVLALAQAIIVARREIRFEHADRAAARARGAETALVELIRAELISLEQEAGYFSNDRITLFRCDRDHFILVGRRSARPSFDRSLGRPAYPLDEGCLGEAWRSGRAEEGGLPTGGPEDQAPNARWLRAQRTKWRVPEEVARDFSMRSRSYTAFRLQHRDDSIGAVVFESTFASDEVSGEKPGLGLQDLEPILKRHAVRLAALLHASRAIDAARIRAYLEELQDRQA